MMTWRYEIRCTETEKLSSVLPNCKPVSYNSDWPGKMLPGTGVVQIL